MIATFKANNPYNNFLLFIYGVILKFTLFLKPTIPQLQPSDGMLYKYLLLFLKPIGTGAPVIYGFLAYALLFVQAISFNAIVNTQRMLQKPTYLIGMSYLLLTSLFSDWSSFSSPLIVNTVLILVWSKLCKLHNDPSPKTSIFNIGLAIGATAFFYFPALIFILLALFGLAVARPFKMTEWLMVFVGVSTPFYFFGSWLFLTNNYKFYHLPAATISLPVLYQTRWAIVAIILVLICLFLGFAFIQNNLRRQVVQTRKSWQLVYLYLVVAAFIPFLSNSTGFSNWILMAVPVSMIMACALFYPEKRWFPLSMHWAMVLVALAISYFFP